MSAATAYEITNKVRIGKLDIARLLAENFDAILSDARLHRLDISVSHALFAGQMSGSHKDPFDRMLAAQRKLESLSIITVDPAFREFGIDIIW